MVEVICQLYLEKSVLRYAQIAEIQMYRHIKSRIQPRLLMILSMSEIRKTFGYVSSLNVSKYMYIFCRQYLNAKRTSTYQTRTEQTQSEWIYMYLQGQLVYQNVLPPFQYVSTFYQRDSFFLFYFLEQAVFFFFLQESKQSHKVRNQPSAYLLPFTKSIQCATFCLPNRDKVL